MHLAAGAARNAMKNETADLFALPEFNLASEVQREPAKPKATASDSLLFDIEDIRTIAPTALDKHNARVAL